MIAMGVNPSLPDYLNDTFNLVKQKKQESEMFVNERSGGDTAVGILGYWCHSRAID